MTRSARGNLDAARLRESAAKRVVERLAPPPDVAREYGYSVNHFHSLVRDRAWKLRRSSIFPDVAFLVGFTEGPESALRAADLDAVAMFEERHPRGTLVPHHVRCRTEDQRRRDTQFRGVLEHEFVHVCQHLKGEQYPVLVAPGADASVDAAVGRVWMELEAELVQRVLVDRRAAERGDADVAEYVLLRAFHPVLEDLAALTPVNARGRWVEAVNDVLRYVEAHLIEDSAALWGPVVHEFVGHLPVYLRLAWTTGQSQRSKRERPQP